MVVIPSINLAPQGLSIMTLIDAKTIVVPETCAPDQRAGTDGLQRQPGREHALENPISYLSQGRTYVSP